MNIRPLIVVMHIVAVFGLFAVPQTLCAQENAADTTKPVVTDLRSMILFDNDPFPDGYPQINPYNVLALFTCWKTPILDHTGKPHKHNRVIQVIVDGGNGVQDPPNPDGTPGGDDSLAYGNFNMIRVLGADGLFDPKGQSGFFITQKYFIPYLPDRAYYLRFWEGEDVATAPYYQNSVEYVSDNDRGGSMIRFYSSPPIDVDWKFGPSKPRPTIAPKK